MRKTLTFILALALCFGITACAEQTQAEETLHTEEIIQAPTPPPDRRNKACYLHLQSRTNAECRLLLLWPGHQCSQLSRSGQSAGENHGVDPMSQLWRRE